MYSFGNFSAFFLWSPIGNHEKKSCLNKLKFWEASRNHKRSLSWKFQYSILKNAETSHIPASISENPVPLYEFWGCPDLWGLLHESRIYEKAHLISDFRKKISPWLGLEPTKMISFLQCIFPKPSRIIRIIFIYFIIFH